MNKPAVSFSGKTIYIDSRTISVKYPVIAAYLNDGKIIVLYDPDANPKNYGQFRNLVAIDLYGRELWEAEFPESTTPNSYYKISSEDPLEAYCFSSHSCRIDKSNGKLIDCTFYK